MAALRWFDQQAEAIVPMVARGKKDPPSGGSYAKQLVFSKRDRYQGRGSPHVALEGKRKRTEQSVKKKVFSSQVRKNGLMSSLTGENSYEKQNFC